MTRKIFLSKDDAELFKAFREEANKQRKQEIDGTREQMSIPLEFQFYKEEVELIQKTCFKRKKTAGTAAALEASLIAQAYLDTQVKTPPPGQPPSIEARDEIKRLAKAIQTIGVIAETNKQLVKKFATLVAQRNSDIDGDDPNQESTVNEFIKRRDKLCSPDFYKTLSEHYFQAADRVPIGQGKGKAQSHHISALIFNFYEIWIYFRLGEFTTSPGSHCYEIAAIYLRLCGHGITNFKAKMQMVKADKSNDENRAKIKIMQQERNPGFIVILI